MGIDLDLTPAQEELLLWEGKTGQDKRAWRDQCQMLLGGAVGPLQGDHSLAFSSDVAFAAWVTCATFLRSSDSGILRNKPAYEAWALISTRLTLALRRCRGLHLMHVDLMRSLGIDPMAALRREDQVWMRITMADPGGKRIARLRSTTAHSEIITAAQAASGWFWDVRRLYA